MKPQSIDGWLSQLDLPSADRDYKPGHVRMQALLEPLDLPKPKLRIRIAGTNGKGSTAFMLAAGLQAAGLKVGLYTSPHVLAFNERIRINNLPVSDENLLTLLTLIMPIALQVGASYFEVATALALKHFSQTNVDVEILEAGVGARLDATTAVAADMALITPIGLDHQNWLGDHLSSIATEKSYALDGCRWGLSAPQAEEVRPILRLHCADLHEVEVKHVACSMVGQHQHINAALAMAALDILLKNHKITGDTNILHQAACAAVAPGRLQYIPHKQAQIWLDAAHNRHAVEAILPSLSLLAKPFDAILVYTREDRSLADCLDLLRPYTTKLIGSIAGHVDIYETSPEKALKHILTEQPSAKILLIGSFLSVAASIKYLEK